MEGRGVAAVKGPRASWGAFICSGDEAGQGLKRWLRTVRAEATDRMLITGPRHLHAILGHCAVHYNRHRPHRARNLRPPGSAGSAPAAITDLTTVKV